MGVLNRFRAAVQARATPTPRAPARMPWSGDPLLPLTGTTTTCAAAVASLIARGQLPERGYLESAATLQREPDNPVDQDAVAVLVDGERVGYLPGWAARQLALPPGAATPAVVQLFTAPQDGAVRAVGWVWLGEDAPSWRYDAKDRAPVTREEKRAAEHAQRREMVADAVAGGGARAAQFAGGMVNGVHYLELVEPIKQLKREGRLEEALALCYAAIAGAEKEATLNGWPQPAPFYTEQAAIVLRKLGLAEEEAAVLRRYLAQLPDDCRDASPFAARLAKLGRSI